jgi:hypothetical protein
MADIYHVIMYVADDIWKCRTGACNFEVHEEDLERVGYSVNREYSLHINERELSECIAGETTISDGTDSTPPLPTSILTSPIGEE